MFQENQDDNQVVDPGERKAKEINLHNTHNWEVESRDKILTNHFHPRSIAEKNINKITVENELSCTKPKLLQSEQLQIYVYTQNQAFVFYKPICPISWHV